MELRLLDGGASILRDFAPSRSRLGTGGDRIRATVLFRLDLMRAVPEHTFRCRMHAVAASFQ